MFHQRDAMRVMAEKYLRLARSAADPRERSKFFDYAMIYAQLSEQAERLRGASKARAGAARSAKMISTEEMLSHDLPDDDASLTLRVTADLLEKSAGASRDRDRREALLDYAKLYREMAELSDRSHAEAENENEQLI